MTTSSKIRTDLAVDPTATGDDRASSGSGGGDLATHLQRYALLLALVALIAVFSVLRTETFFTVANLTTILSIQATAAMLAMGVTLVLIIGEFDLSVAAVMGLSASLIAYLTTEHGVSVPLACLVALALAAIVGLVNAALVVGAGLNSFIVTLAVGTLVQGLAIGVAGSVTIGGLPTSLTYPFQSRFLDVQAAFFFMLAVAFVLYLVVGRMPIGRSMFFTGNARAAAELAGVRTARVRVGVMMTAGLLAGAAGVMFVGQTGAASPSIADPFLLPAYAAGFLGATAFTPGRFNVWGSVWAVYLLAVGTTGFQFLGLDNWVINVFNGGVLVLAVGLSRFFARKART
ncbi:MULTISPECIES: ABC transporter permease [unclassified Nocardioides]|uniref:ABC transporter permease n=1 Tax=unclassified Nocardioides TaxID=2615069 RepID=UPI000056FB89|nr:MULTISPECIES: ABC transporter permease [unclassified Nocardioides]ABL80206.1 monosaccharide ABC transporter membrane protein, CUT2 family [Nocardioides sp. JS614]